MLLSFWWQSERGAERQRGLFTQCRAVQQQRARVCQHGADEQAMQQLVRERQARGGVGAAPARPHGHGRDQPLARQHAQPGQRQGGHLGPRQLLRLRQYRRVEPAVQAVGADDQLRPGGDEGAGAFGLPLGRSVEGLQTLREHFGQQRMQHGEVGVLVVKACVEGADRAADLGRDVADRHLRPAPRAGEPQASLDQGLLPQAAARLFGGRGVLRGQGAASQLHHVALHRHFMNPNSGSC